MLQDCNDRIFERLDINLDEMAGLRKTQTPQLKQKQYFNSPLTGSSGIGSWNLNRNVAGVKRLITQQNIERPQLKFKIPVDNSGQTVFIPKIKDKPNSIKPLSILPEYDDTGNIASYLHPYEFELHKFKVPDEQLQEKRVKLPNDINAVDFEYVNTISKLLSVLEELRKQKEIAIDVEHHSFRSFLGFTCLVQISTRDKDYIFDALELRDEMHVLNEIFTDQKVVKIFHGADLDIEWLQRDLALYVVNMFDTHQAAKTLGFPRLSLAYLLKRYCEVDADKTYQLADWRVRPLPDELIKYARQDTHYLIYIYERLTNDLLEASNSNTNLLRNIYLLSTEICKKRYNKPVIEADSYLVLYRNSKRIFDNRQLYALQKLYLWRDKIAREEDESYGYVLPNHMMLHIADNLPREMHGIYACCNPIPPLVRQYLRVLHEIILKAREQPLIKPLIDTENVNRNSNISTRDYNSKLYCPHDLMHDTEMRDDLPTLLQFTDDKMLYSARDEIEVQLSKPIVKIFDKSFDEERENQKKQLRTLYKTMKFVTPYQRYLAILPLIEKEQKQEAARLDELCKHNKLCPDPTDIQNDEERNDTNADESKDETSIKEYLKRKYDESVANKTNKSLERKKRFKYDSSNERCLESNNVSSQMRNEQNCAANVETKTKKRRNMHIKRNTSEINEIANTVISKTRSDDLEVSAISDTTVKRENTSAVIASGTDVDDEPPDEMPSTSQSNNDDILQQQIQQSQLKSKRKRNINKKSKFRNRNNLNQSSNKPVQINFDYGKVDYKKFKGGAQRAKGPEIKPQFHGKGRTNKASNKMFNKVLTFGDVKFRKK